MRTYFAKVRTRYLILKNNDFQFASFKLVSYCVQKGGESSTFKNWYLKTLLNTKRRISSKGSFV